jgi:hypothetical protein
MVQLGYALILLRHRRDYFQPFSAFLAQGNRDDIANAKPQSDDSTTEKARAMKTECLRVIEPNAAPANIATTAVIRRCKRGLVPCAKDESAAMPVMVNVSTVVLRSGTADLRTAAFLIPIAMAVKAIMA